MKSILDRGSLTTVLLATLAAAEYLTQTFPVGDAGAPDFDAAAARNAGWNGEPNAPGSFYVPYWVLTPSTATLSSGSFNDPQNAWRLPYTLATFGLGRAQTEALANVGRKALRSLHHTTQTLDGVAYKVQQVEFNALGGVGRVDQTSPSTYGEVDTFTVWLSQ